MGIIELSVSVVIPTHNRREKLVRLINSIEKSVFPNIEIVVVDDASTDGTYEEIKRFPNVKIIRNEEERLVSACRNLGINNSKGDFIFLVDDDNVLEEYCINKLVEMLVSQNAVGVVAPIMYYYSNPKTVWCAGIKRNLTSSQTITIGNGKIDTGQFNIAIESHDFPNAFMVRREIVKEEGVLFDDKYFPLVYEESDFCYRVRKNGWKIVVVPGAKIWHDVPKELFFMGRYTNLKAYYLGRNRIIFHKKYSKRYEFSVFKMFFLPIFTLAYAFLVLQHWFLRGKFLSGIKISKSYIKGTVDGIKIIREITK
jgi:GT2 family glycosyltransferase